MGKGIRKTPQNQQMSNSLRYSFSPDGWGKSTVFLFLDKTLLFLPSLNLCLRLIPVEMKEQGGAGELSLPLPQLPP